jgi:hypothetical protein
MKTLLTPLILVFVACGGAATDANKTGDNKTDAPAGAKAGPVELTKVGLKMNAPAGSTVGDQIAGSGVTVQGPNLVVNVEEASDSRPKTGEDAQKDADMYSPKNAKVEALPDGWTLTFDNEGGMGKNYFVQVRREIGGKSYWCETTASSPEQQRNALDACKSLTK